MGLICSTLETLKLIRAPPTSWRCSIVFGLSVRLSVLYCGHSNLVIFNQISSKFHIWIASIKLCSSSNMGFFHRKIIKMADKMAAAYQFKSIGCCGHSNLVILNRISSKFHIWFAFIKPWLKFEYEFFPPKDNQDGLQNGRCLSVYIHPLLWSL